MVSFLKTRPGTSALENLKILLACALAWSCLMVFSPFKASAAMETIKVLKEQLSELEKQIHESRARKKELEENESRLTEEIKRLKTESRSRPGLLLNLRLENSLKELRSLLVSIREVEKKQRLLQGRLIKTREELKDQVEKEISRLIESAKVAFKAGNESDADRDYKGALQLMEEHKNFSREFFVNDIVLPPRMDLFLTGKESPGKLRELSDFARNDIENLKKEIGNLQETRNRIEEEIGLRKNLIQYPGLLEREGEDSLNQRNSIEQEILKLEKTRKLIDYKVIKYKETIQILTRKSREIDHRIGPIEKRQE